VNKVRFGPANIDVIFMDCNISKTDSAEATLEIMKSNNKKDIAFIGLSVNLARVKVEECLKAGMKRVFQKSVNFGILLDYIKDVAIKGVFYWLYIIGKLSISS